MIVCPRCGTVNGQRKADPVKCTRCWYVFRRAEEREHDSQVNHRAEDAPERPKRTDVSRVARRARGVRMLESSHGVAEDRVEIEAVALKSCPTCHALNGLHQKGCKGA